MYRFDRFKLPCDFESLKDIDLRYEVKKAYTSYPKSIVNGFIKHGIYTLYEMKVFLDEEENSFCRIRNIGPKRKALALALIKKYETEAIKTT